MNNPRLVANMVFAIICVIFGSKSFAEPTNLANLKNTLREYHDSGIYLQELSTVAKQADQYITQQATLNAKSSHPKKLAIVLDIDETSLSNYAHIEALDFGFNDELFHRNCLLANDPPIDPVLSLYKNAIAHQVAVFFITGRHPSEYQATVKNLKAAGYETWTKLYLKPQKYQHTSATVYKSQTRALIEQQGYTILASIGDQLTDLNGGYAQKTFKLPNPYYYID